MSQSVNYSPVVNTLTPPAGVSPGMIYGTISPDQIGVSFPVVITVDLSAVLKTYPGFYAQSIILQNPNPTGGTCIALTGLENTQTYSTFGNASYSNAIQRSLAPASLYKGPIFWPGPGTPLQLQFSGGGSSNFRWILPVFWGICNFPLTESMDSLISPTQQTNSFTADLGQLSANVALLTNNDAVGVYWLDPIRWHAVMESSSVSGVVNFDIRVYDSGGSNVTYGQLYLSYDGGVYTRQAGTLDIGQIVLYPGDSLVLVPDTPASNPDTVFDLTFETPYRRQVII